VWFYHLVNRRWLAVTRASRDPDDGPDTEVVDSAHPDVAAGDAKADGSAASLVRINEVYVDRALDGDAVEWVELSAAPQASSARPRRNGRDPLRPSGCGRRPVVGGSGLWVIGGPSVSVVASGAKVDKTYSHITVIAAPADMDHAPQAYPAGRSTWCVGTGKRGVMPVDWWKPALGSLRAPHLAGFPFASGRRSVPGCRAVCIVAFAPRRWQRCARRIRAFRLAEWLGTNGAALASNND
jgi:hypothetical protein